MYESALCVYVKLREKGVCYVCACIIVCMCVMDIYLLENTIDVYCKPSERIHEKS